MKVDDGLAGPWLFYSHDHGHDLVRSRSIDNDEPLQWIGIPCKLRHHQVGTSLTKKQCLADRADSGRNRLQRSVLDAQAGTLSDVFEANHLRLVLLPPTKWILYEQSNPAGREEALRRFHQPPNQSHFGQIDPENHVAADFGHGARDQIGSVPQFPPSVLPDATLRALGQRGLQRSCLGRCIFHRHRLRLGFSHWRACWRWLFICWLVWRDSHLGRRRGLCLRPLPLIRFLRH